jgi:hypothetical protein
MPTTPTRVVPTGAVPSVALIAWYLDWQRSPDIDEMGEWCDSCELCGARLDEDSEDVCERCVERGQIAA